MKNTIFGTMRSRIFAALFAISLVPIAVLGVQGYHCSMQAVNEMANKHLLAVADARATAVLNWINEKTRTIETFATFPMTASLFNLERVSGGEGTALLEESLGAFRLANPSFAKITLVNAEWELAAESMEGTPARSFFIDPELRKKMETTGGVVYGVAQGDKTEDVGLHVACSIENSTETVVGFLVAYLDLTKSLTPILQDRQGLYETGKVFIVSEDGEILTEPLLNENVAFTKWSAAPLEGVHVHALSPGVTHYRDYKGNQVLGASIPISFEGWKLVAEMDSIEALNWLKILLIRALLTGLVTCFVVVGIAFWISHLVGTPLRELMRVSHRIRAGHVEERLEKMEVTEAEEVRKAFNAMLDELREKQEELVRTTTLAYVGELTSSTVHEMRNPLSSIRMNLQALSRSKEQDSRSRELNEIALQQTMRLDQMLTDLLNFGKPVKLHPATLTFEELMDTVLDVIGEGMAHNNIKVQIDDALGDNRLYIDKEQMCRALTNLAGNAKEAMTSGGEITVMARPIADPSGGIELAVLDTGPGLSEEALQRAFQPFYTTKSTGTGLGLPNIMKIVALHGGSILVENRPDGGAAFRISLPDKCVKWS